MLQTPQKKDPHSGESLWADAWMPLERLSLPSFHKGSRSGKKKQLIRSAAFQFICKFLYLVFPRDIHDSFGIVVETVA